MPAQRTSPRKPSHFTRFTTTRAIPSILFDASKTTGITVDVPALVADDGKSRFPCLEAILGREAPLHDCIVAVADNAGHVHKYVITTQIGEGLPRNRSLRDIYPDCDWRGSLLVMKCGKKSLPFVGLAGGADKDRAEIAIQQFLYDARFAPVTAEVKKNLPSDIWY